MANPTDRLCPACYAIVAEGARYCGQCGAAALPVLTPPADTTRDASQPQHDGDTATLAVLSAARTTPPPPPPPGAFDTPDDPYPPSSVALGVVAALFVPFLSLVAALLLRSNESVPARRDQLRKWAIGSGVWLVTGWILSMLAVGLVIGSAGGSDGECSGGIDRLVAPQFVSTDQVHWDATYACVNGGHLTKPARPNQVRGF